MVISDEKLDAVATYSTTPGVIVFNLVLATRHAHPDGDGLATQATQYLITHESSHDDGQARVYVFHDHPHHVFTALAILSISSRIARFSTLPVCTYTRVQL